MAKPGKASLRAVCLGKCSSRDLPVRLNLKGTEDEVEPNYQLLAGQQFVGTFHTHSYATGWLGIAFSGEDIASALLHQENISIVHSGNKIAAFARTEMTPKFVEWEFIETHARELVKTYSHIFSFPDTVLKRLRGETVAEARKKMTAHLTNHLGKLVAQGKSLPKKSGRIEKIKVSVPLP